MWEESVGTVQESQVAMRLRQTGITIVITHFFVGIVKMTIQKLAQKIKKEARYIIVKIIYS